MNVNYYGPTLHLIWDDDRGPVFAFGKLNGMPVYAVARASPSYLVWIINAQPAFPVHVVNTVDEALVCSARDDRAAFMRWARKQHAKLEAAKPVPVSVADIKPQAAVDVRRFALLEIDGISPPPADKGKKA